MHLLTHLIEMSLSGPLRVDTRFLGMCYCYCWCCCFCKSPVAQVALNLLCSPRSNLACTSDAPHPPSLPPTWYIQCWKLKPGIHTGQAALQQLSYVPNPGSSVYVLSVSQQYKHSWENPQDCPNTQLFNLTCLKVKCISRSR